MAATIPALDLPPEVTAKLKEIPETGMGYQVVDFTFDDGTVWSKIVVIQCQQIIGFYQDGYVQPPAARTFPGEITEIAVYERSELQ